LANDSDVEDEAIPLDRVLAATHAAKKLSLIILDACRENPFLHAEAGTATKRVSFKGLVPVEATGTNTLVAYAAKAGSVSFDGAGMNSPFATALMKYIAEPGLDIRTALGKVRDEVLAATGNQQEPSIYGSLEGTTIFLVPASSRARALDGQDADHAAASDYEQAEREGSRQAWQVFLAAHNSGYYADLARVHLAGLPSIETKLPPIETTKPTLAPPEAPNKAAGPLDGQDADHVAASDYEQAEREDSRQAWQVFLAAHSSGYYADLARIHLARLPPIETKLPPIATTKPTMAAPEPLNKAAAPLDGQDADHVAASDYEQAQREGSRQAWQVFLAAHSSGYYADLARIHLARLPPIETKLPPMEATKPTIPAPETPNNAGPASAGRSLEDARQPAGVIPSNTMTPEQACKSDAAKLAALRLNPSPDQVAKFSSALMCEDLRPQVERFVESLGIEIQGDQKSRTLEVGEQKSRTLEAPPQGESSDREQICKRESEELSRLRANPIRENAVRFARDLKCEDLKAQVARLLESISD
jgi:glutaredoxin